MTSKSPFVYLHPSNALTYGSVLAGLLAVVFAVEFRSWHLSGALIVLSAFFDVFDGRFANLFKRTDDLAEFGCELDSLTDAVVFGFVPIACSYILIDFGSDTGIRALWVIAALIYIVCTLTRLGCFNLHQSQSNYFLGIPTTLSALLLSAFFLVRPSGLGSAVVLFICGFAMVAPIYVPRARGSRAVMLFTLLFVVFVLHLSIALRDLQHL